jgi:hypothetical protein
MSNDEKVLKVLHESPRMLSLGEIEKRLKPDELRRQSIQNALRNLHKLGQVEKSYDFSRDPPRSVWGINTNSPEQIHLEYCKEFSRLSCAEVYGRFLWAQSVAFVMKPVWDLQFDSLARALSLDQIGRIS